MSRKQQLFLKTLKCVAAENRSESTSLQNDSGLIDENMLNYSFSGDLD